MTIFYGKAAQYLRSCLILVTSATIVLFYSCEDVIPIKLNNAQPVLVVEGNINNVDHFATLRLTYSTDYFNPVSGSDIDNANVSVMDNYGITFDYKNSGHGVYSTKTYSHPIGIEGRKYILTIKVNNTEYSATTVMPKMVNLDTVILGTSINKNYTNALNCYFQDPRTIANYYLLRVYADTILLTNKNHILISSDKYYNGNLTCIQISPGDAGLIKFSPDYMVVVELISIDDLTFMYFKTLLSITDQISLSTSTLSNPSGNINNGALGYFSAWSVSKKLLIAH